MTSWKEVSEVAKNLVQIIAILVAAIWTYLVFVRTEGPLLEARASAHSDLVWYPSSAYDACIAQLYVTFENIGKAAFRIDRVQLRAWSFDRRLRRDEALHYVDLTEIQKVEPLFSKDYGVGPFAKRYPPGESFRHTFEWVVRREEAAELYFRIDFFEPDSSSSSWHTGSWSPFCQSTTGGDESDRDSPSIDG